MEVQNAAKKSRMLWKYAQPTLLKVDTMLTAVIKEGKRVIKKINVVQDKVLKQAMEVSDYNKGRTVADVSNKTYIHGTRKYLRPDTIWADDRYTDVTHEEIEAAKVRYEQRLASQGRKLVEPLAKIGHHDSPDYAYSPPESRHIYAQPILKH